MSASIGGTTPGLDAAGTGRRLARFRPPRAHINTLIARSGRTVLDRARYLVRNNHYAANGCEYFAAQIIGAGITPAWRGPVSLKKALSDAFLAWTDEADAEGLTDFYGLQRRAAREVFIAGEVFLRKRFRFAGDGLTVPFQLQMLASEMLPGDDNRLLPNGNEVRAGIEFDRIGRRVAYHFCARHPDDTATARGATTEQVRVPADQVIHIMDPVEAGQLRGLSRLAPGIVKFWMLDLFDDAELDRKRVVALHVGVITEPSGEGDPSSTGAEDEGDGTGTLDMAPGALLSLPPGKSITFHGPADVGGSYEAFQYRNLLAAAASCGLPYVGLTGDMVKANYSNVRAALMDFRRRAEALQHGVFVHQFCRVVGQEWLRQAVLANAIRGLTPEKFVRDRAKLLPIAWQPPRWEWIDPLKDMRADAEEVAAGLASRQAKIRARGEDPDRVDAERAEDMAREKRLGLAPVSPLLGHNGGPKLDAEDPDKPAPDDGADTIEGMPE